MKEFRHTTEQKVVWRDLDTLGHVNNAVYATYFENGRLDYISSLNEGDEKIFELILAEITISYKSPAFLHETLVIGVRISQIRNSSIIVESQIEEKSTGRLVATSRGVIVHYDYTENKSKPVPQRWRELIGQLEGWES